jgi:hypothetical protein
VQLEDEDLDDSEDALIRIICFQSFAEDGTEEKLALQLKFVSSNPSHDRCAMELLNHDVEKLRSI